jgi:SAM-dependent methyltransferase
VAADPFWEFERQGWNAAADSYEECWSDTGLFIEPLLDAAAVREGSKLLDLACGPGLVSEAAVERGATPAGLDFAPTMIERARMRCPGLTFVEGDAQNLGFEDGVFDAVTMNFGILHLSKPEAALSEARRVLVPGGRFAYTVWVEEGHIADEILDAAIAAHAAPVELPHGPPVYRFADADVARAALAEAGFDGEAAEVETITAPWRVPTPEFPFEAHMRAGVQQAGVLRAQSPERQEAITKAIAEGVRPYADGDGYTLPIVARVVSARAAG